jgi:DNA-binding NarL/FixJ family response regulator
VIAAPPLFLIAQRDTPRAEATLTLLHAQGFDALPPVFDGQDVLNALVQHQPTVAILGCELPGPSLPILLQRLADYALPTRLIVHTHNPDPGAALEAFRAGARGYLPCEVEPEELLFCVRSVLRGNLYLSPALLGEVMGVTLRALEDHHHRALRRELTDRELEIFILIGQGYSSKQIAQRLHPQVSEDTVETHRRHIREKLGIKGGGSALTQQAILFVRRMRW